jgi:hypothetical protein
VEDGHRPFRRRARTTAVPGNELQPRVIPARCSRARAPGSATDRIGPLWSSLTRAGGRARGSLAPFPIPVDPSIRRFRGNVFYSIPWASLRLSQHPHLGLLHSVETVCTTRGATGTGRTIGHRHRTSSNDLHHTSPGCLDNSPGHGFTGFPAADIELRRSSARRSAFNRPRSSSPSSTCDMASANSRCPAWSRIKRCISCAAHR